MNPLIRQVDEYLATEPTDADEQNLKLWRKVKIVDCAMLEKYWLMVDKHKIDYRDCMFENHKTGKAIFKGEIQKGPQRFLDMSKTIVTCTKRINKHHGLTI